MKPILVGLDGSELAERGLSLATELAKGLDDKVIAARVVPPTWSGGGYDPELRQRLEVADEAAAAGYLAKVADRLRADSVRRKPDSCTGTHGGPFLLPRIRTTAASSYSRHTD